MKSVLLLGVLMLFLSVQTFSQKVFSVQYENQAEVKIFVVQYENQADVKICFVKYENQAGWRNNSVKHLFY